MKAGSAGSSTMSCHGSSPPNSAVNSRRTARHSAAVRGGADWPDRSMAMTPSWARNACHACRWCGRMAGNAVDGVRRQRLVHLRQRHRGLRTVVEPKANQRVGEQIVHGVIRQTPVPARAGGPRWSRRVRDHLRQIGEPLEPRGAYLSHLSPDVPRSRYNARRDCPTGVVGQFAAKRVGSRLVKAPAGIEPAFHLCKWCVFAIELRGHHPPRPPS